VVSSLLAQVKTYYAKRPRGTTRGVSSGVNLGRGPKPLKPPFKVMPFADVGTQEPFLARLGPGLIDILNATTYLKRQEITEAIMKVSTDCIIPAFTSLRELRKIAGDPAAPLLNKIKSFDDLCRYLWTAYKDRMQSAARIMGYDIGFLFQKDAAFEAGCESFLKANPKVRPALVEVMKHNRATWQTDLGRFRNEYLEHQKMTQEEVAGFYSLARAEELFEVVWITIEEILALLMEADLPAGACLREIPESERSPSIPLRFGFGWLQAPPGP